MFDMRGRGALVCVAAICVAALFFASGFVLTPYTAGGRAVDVHGAPVAGATASIVAHGAVVDSARASSDGAFQVAGGVKAARPVIVVSAPGYLPARVTGTEPVVLHRQPVVQGRAVDGAGAGLADVTVEVEGAGGRRWLQVTDPDGFFWFQWGLVPGHALVTASAPGRDVFRQQVQLEADHVVQLDAHLDRPTGFVDLTTDPPGLRPQVDGRPVEACTATPCTLPVEMGSHVLSLDSDLYAPWSSQITAWEGQHLAVSARLERKTGTLTVSAPSGANAVLAVDGQAVPLSWTGLLPTGSHLVTYSADDRWAWAASVEVTWNDTAKVAVASGPVVPGDEQGFLQGMQAYLSSLPGRFSAWVTPLAGGSELSYHASDSMEAASVIKIPVALYVYHQAQAGALKLTDTVQLQGGDFMGGTGTLNGTANPGDRYSYQDLVARLIQQSDNTAWMALTRDLGPDRIDSYAASIGAGDCHQEDDRCTAREAGLMLQQLAQGRLLNQAYTQTLLNLLETTVFNDRINYYLGGYPIAHKAGMDGSVMNDSGVVYGPRPFVVSMFTDADPTVGVEAIRQVARLAARLYSR